MATLTQFEYLIAVNKTRHFGRAAKSCHVSQPSLSAQIHKLEEELGLTIFDRSKSPVLVTEKGAKVILQAQRVLGEYNKVISMSGLNAEVSGPFQLGVIPTLSAYIIPLFVEEFSKKYPKVELTIRELQTSEIITLLHNDELDGGILVTPLHEDQIIERSLFLEPFYAFISESHKLSKRKIVNTADLDSNSVWLLNEGHCFRNQVLKLCERNKGKSALTNIHFESGNLETLKNLVKKGIGLTLLPHLAANNLSPKERAKYLKKFNQPIPTREVSLVYSRSFLKQEILTALEEEIIKSLPEDIKLLKKTNVEIIEIY